MNLLHETVTQIGRSGHSPADVAFIGSRDGEYACTWDEFAAMADREYDPGFGVQEVADDLIVRFADGGWLERHEYDGAEGWTYRPPFHPTATPNRIERVIRDGDYYDAYSGVAALHRLDEDA